MGAGSECTQQGTIQEQLKPRFPIVVPQDMAPDAIRYWLGRAPDVIVEIGCNDGTDTVKFLEAFPQAKMYCFEPDPRAATAFRENVKNHRAYLLQLAVPGCPPLPREDGRPSRWETRCGLSMSVGA